MAVALSLFSRLILRPEVYEAQDAVKIGVWPVN